MLPQNSQSKQRRREVRKTIAAVTPRWRQRFQRAGGPPGVLLAAVFYLVVLALNIWPLEPLRYRVGQYVPEDIRARIGFSLPAPQAPPPRSPDADIAPASFQLNEKLLAEIEADLRALPDRLAEREAVRPGPTTKPATRPATTRPTTRPADEPPDADTVRAEALNRLLGPGGREQYDKRISDLIEGLKRQAILSPEQVDLQQRRSIRHVILYGAAADAIYKPVSDLLAAGTEEQSDRLKRKLIDLTQALPETVRQPVRDLLTERFIEREQALYAYDKQRSAREVILPAVATTDQPKVFGRGQLLVRASRRRSESEGHRVEGLGAEELKLLEYEHEAFREYERRHHPWRLAGRAAGRAGLLLGIVVLTAFYVVRYRPELLQEPLRGAAVGAVLATILGIVKALDLALSWNPHVAVLPVAMGAMVLAITFDQRFALAMGAILALLAALQLHAGLDMAVVLATAVTVCAALLDDVRTRSKLIRVSAAMAACVFGAVWAMGLIDAVPTKFILIDASWAAGMALLSGFLVQGLLPLIERLFGVATSMTLLEWCDASKPLLRHLAMEAPGTYNHSLQLGSLCEAAADAIGARGLLARTGAYYHDIGKINKPPYFVENQVGGASKHAKLSPAMSLLIVTGHVKDGLEMAREYGLPSVLREFIATHHGTTLVQYFYHAATEQSRRSGDDSAPDEMEFRYPGPKPRSKEAGILMLADAAESSVRAMSDPTPGRIENQVHAMVMRRLMDGQLSECTLTLKEVHTIEASLTRSLCSIYHSRIAYPTPANEKPSAAETPREETPREPKDDAEDAAPAPQGARPAERRAADE